MYTLMVAAMDREVVAVDAMADNLAYIRHSLHLANKEHLVTLVHNAIRYPGHIFSRIFERKHFFTATLMRLSTLSLWTLSTPTSSTLELRRWWESRKYRTQY